MTEFSDSSLTLDQIRANVAAAREAAAAEAAQVAERPAPRRHRTGTGRTPSARQRARISERRREQHARAALDRGASPLRVARIERKMTQRQAADAIGVADVRTVRRAETGKPVANGTADRIFQVFGVRVAS